MKRIEYQIVGRYRDEGSIDLQREVFYLVNGEWKRSSSAIYMIDAPMGRFSSVTWQGEGEVDKHLFDELANQYRAILDWSDKTGDQGILEIIMDAEPSFGD